MISTSGLDGTKKSGVNRLGDCGRLGRHVNVSWAHQEMQWQAWRAGPVVVGETKVRYPVPEQYQSFLTKRLCYCCVTIIS